MATVTPLSFGEIMIDLDKYTKQVNTICNALIDLSIYTNLDEWTVIHSELRKAHECVNVMHQRIKERKLIQKQKKGK